MFPLKRRRKFARIHKKGLKALVTVNGNVVDALVKDISASGCNISFPGEKPEIAINDIVSVEFTLNEIDFVFEAEKVRTNGYNFKFESRESQTKLNNEILTEYFKDTPELMPIEK